MNRNGAAGPIASGASSTPKKPVPPPAPTCARNLRQTSGYSCPEPRVIYVHRACPGHAVKIVDLVNPVESRLTKKNLEAIALLDKRVMEGRSWDERLIDQISKRVGSKWFFYLNVVLFLSWFALNSTTYGLNKGYDPYPFSLLSLLLSVEVLFVSMFILLSQSWQNSLVERRDHLELQLILLAEQENTVQIDLLLKIAKRLNIEVYPLPNEMLGETEPSVLVSHLEEIFDKHDLDVPGVKARI